ncbi:MAG TPA: biosynthetic-type acetolactate synthase large subunit [Syntrophales bacterium]|nr:biosynthetic-type acetolactate synthase large subunit [Syntrophales bacterium]
MKLKGAEIFIRALKQEGIQTVFGYPGGVLLDIYDELHRSDITHILVRHEQGAVHAADGYARASGKVGVVLVTSGPGATNTVTGIANAYLDSIPIVVFTGQVPTALIGTDAFQEADIVGITRPCTKHNFQVRRVDELARTIHEAFHIARSGRPGPVLVDLPKDVMQATTDYEPSPPKEEEPVQPPRPASGKALYVLDLIAESRRPVLLTGGGIVLGRASEELRQMARRTKIPVTSTLMGLGAFPASDPLWLGMPGMHGTYYANMALSNCDLLIAIGCRFDDRVTGNLETFARKAKKVHVDVDASSINKNVMVDVPIVQDCKEALRSFNKLLADQNFTVSDEDRREWFDMIDEWKRNVPLSYCPSDEVIKPQFVIETLCNLTKGKAIITTEVGQNQMWAAQFYKFDEPNMFISSGGLGTMGFGLPAAIGAQVAFPDKLVVDIAGDGSIQMNIQELATAVQYNIPVKVVVLNNGYLGMVRQWQELFYEKRYSQTDMTYAPDFVKVAEAYGMLGVRAVKPDEVEATLRKGLEHPGPVIMDFRVAREECVYPMVRPGGSIQEMALGREMIN